MGLLKKVKDILFDEEEDFTEQIKITPEMRNEESEVKKESFVKEVKKDEIKIEHHDAENESLMQSEKDLFQNDSTFPFFDDFDEKEFESINQKKQEPIKPSRDTVYNYERNRKPERRNDIPIYSKPDIHDNNEKKKFKPSPIISPVFGVLDKDYSKDDIIPKVGEKLTVEKVRDKAFGEKREPEKIFYEETKTVTISNPEETQKKVKTIDELLENTSDIIVDIDKDLEDEIDSFIPKEVASEKVEMKQIKEDDNKLDDTLESDLFDLIDQMYSNKEEGED